MFANHFCNFLICIQLLDSVNYVWTKLSTVTPKVDSVHLKVIKWTKLANAAALIQCETTSFAPGMEMLFLFKPGQTQNKPNSNVYHVIGRRLIKLAAVGLSTALNFSWLEVPTDMEGAQLYCLVWPQVSANRDLKWLSALPTPSGTILISKPVSNLLTLPNCPTAPKIRLDPDLEKSLYPAKTKLDVVCEGPATANALPFKFYYLSLTFSIIFCSNASIGANGLDDGTSLEYESSCFPVSPFDTTCDNPIKQDDRENHYYIERCTDAYRRDLNNAFRKIEFTVVTLRPKDFGAHVFCEVIDLYSVRSIEDAQEFKFHSDVKVITFKFSPHIAQFDFQSDKETWKCRALMFPLLQTGSIRVVSTSSVWLQKQMSYYDSVANFTQPQILHGHLIPKNHSVQLNYTVDMDFAPNFTIPGGLREGRMKLRCSLGRARKDLVTVITNRSQPIEPITKVPSVPEAGKSIHFTCRFPRSYSSVSGVVLHRVVRTSWLNYDLSVSSVTMVGNVGEKWTRLPDRHLRMHGMGLWGRKSLGPTTMLTATEQTDESIDFTIGHSKVSLIYSIVPVLRTQSA